jgi:branched-chain amino acid transport system ATP-binding protein
MALLETRGLSGFYGDFQALWGIDTCLQPGETVAVIGANGAGKSTYLKAIAGLVSRPTNSVWFDGRPISMLSAAEIMKLGIALVPEGRRLFPSLTVEENLLIGRYGRNIAGPWSLQRIYSLFPAVEARRYSASTTLSGGEQQMTAIGRALISNPRVLLCDEISLGLAPIIVRDLYEALLQVRAEGTSIILVEQDIVQAAKASDRIYCFQEGRLSLAGRPSELSRDQIHLAYFGT